MGIVVSKRVFGMLLSRSFVYIIFLFSFVDFLLSQENMFLNQLEKK